MLDYQSNRGAWLCNCQKKEESVVDPVEVEKKGSGDALMRDGQVELEVIDVKQKKFEEKSS